jgi:hypothetical protein
MNYLTAYPSLCGRLKNWCLAFLAMAPLLLSAQKPPETLEEFEKTYAYRIQQEFLYGTYIPKDLADAFIQFNRLIDDPSRQKFKTLDEEEAANRLFFSLGRWITHNWGFYGGSRFSHYLRELGLSYPDDMARFVIITYHRNLNRKSLDVKSLIERFQNERKMQEEERLKKGTIIHEETRKASKNGG